jgi:Raf kinase inhibitor-like YbhB/YbcL family protein
MIHRPPDWLLALAFAAVPLTAAAEPAALTVTVAGLEPDGRLPLRFAYCAPPGTPDNAHDISPAVTWSPGPAGTKSYVLMSTDLDVPKDLSLINKPGVTLTDETPRMSLGHWLLVDIPPTVTTLAEGVEGEGFVAKGRPLGPTDHGVRGANAYSFFYPKDSPLYGPHGGWDGPCPPRNETRNHRYVTEVWALDIPSLELSGVFLGDAAMAKMQGHILAHGRADAYDAARPGAPTPADAH